MRLGAEMNIDMQEKQDKKITKICEKWKDRRINHDYSTQLKYIKKIYS